jgi:uncharacterized protein (TIGR02421 family)
MTGKNKKTVKGSSSGLIKREAGETYITDTYIDNICRSLKENNFIRRSLPGFGRIHIDRRLPFICVYRKPVKISDEGTENLITGTASYIITSRKSNINKGLSKLLSSIAETLSGDFQSFLILEIWSEEDPGSKVKNNELYTLKPKFRIITNERKGSDIFSTLQSLKTGLSTISILKQDAKVDLLYSKRVCPSKLIPLINAKDSGKFNCHLIGLEVRPIYRNFLTHKLYPMVLASLSGQLIHVLNQAFFEFTKKLTTHEAKHFHALGRRTFVKAAWEVDKKLGELCDKFDFIRQVTPINEAEARREFQKSRYEKLPVFYYRPLPFDPSEFKKTLWNIPIEKIEDSSLKNLFSGKRDELDLQVSMMVNLDSPGFHYGSLQLYGSVDQSLSKLADDILKFLGRKNHNRNWNTINAAKFHKYVRKEFEYYRSLYPSFLPNAEVNEDMYSGLLVSKNNLFIGKEFRVPENRIEALIQHEVGTHLLTYYNGLAQPFQQLHTGLAGYEELQEGLAVLSEYLVGGLNIARFRLLAARVRAAEYMIDGADFVETFQNLVQNFGFSRSVAFTIVMRIFRGGGLTKDIIYLRGFMEILKYIRKGGDIEPLFVGKISSSHISIIKELEIRRILNPVPLKPRYLRSKEAIQRLNKLKRGFSIIHYVKKLKKDYSI